jgi:predicted GIY-YIG superfamily endonuclease
MNIEALLEGRILETIKKKRDLPHAFAKLVDGFETKFSNFNPSNNCFNISSYFDVGKGQSTATKHLLTDNRVNQEWLRKYETKKGNTKYDFKGLYIFLNANTPFYVGISKGVIGRIFQHIKGNNHNTSTLAYNIGLIRYELINGQKHIGSRHELNFNSEVEPAKQFLLKQQIAWVHIDNDEELYLFEIFCSMKLKTILNKFETH